MPFYSRWFRAVLDFVTETTDPYLNLFRRVVPRSAAAASRSTSARWSR